MCIRDRVYYARVNRFMYAVLAGAAMAGAVMVSYATARAESLVPKSEVGFWDRPERLALMILGALVNRMPIALWILAIGPNTVSYTHLPRESKYSCVLPCAARKLAEFRASLG